MTINNTKIRTLMKVAGAGLGITVVFMFSIIFSYHFWLFFGLNQDLAGFLTIFNSIFLIFIICFCVVQIDNSQERMLQLLNEIRRLNGVIKDLKKREIK